MDHSIIRCEQLSKKFLLHGPQSSYKTLRESLTQAAAAPFKQAARLLRRPSPPDEDNPDTLWALKDINFEIAQGEVVGIIGRNGAGKSTLLKILSRITEPTAGFADVYGRVGSLLEVGTGFHPELTGRENLYLSGAILGMKRSEIRQKEDEIVAFAEIDRFLDTPVKHYSSGMYLRLAFSVAAHLNPNILLVDEVLAVGDIAFQQKCLNHMRSLTRSGMTILLVSHNMAAIQSSCQRAILLNKGRLLADGEPVEVINHFRQLIQDEGENQDGKRVIEAENGSEPVSITSFEMYGTDGVPTREPRFGEPVRIRIEVNAHERIERPMINLGLLRGDGVVACNFNNWYDNFEIDYINGKCALEGWLPPLRLVPDFYEIHVLVWPWGGGHLQGDLTRTQPIAWSTFGDLHISGPGLNAHDGVFQQPALKWRFQRNGTSLESPEIAATSIYEAFGDQPPISLSSKMN